MTTYIRDYYGILGINYNANSKTIKKAYKNATQKYNPKTNNDNNTQKKYILIQEAYQVLSDKKRRVKYDKLYKQAHNKKTNNKKLQLTDKFKLIKGIKDNHDTISKGVKTIIGSKQRSPILTVSKLIIGGVATRYGIKKGKKYINKCMGK